MRKITLEIELSAPDLSLQKDIDFCRELLFKYGGWLIGGMTLIESNRRHKIKRGDGFIQCYLCRRIVSGPVMSDKFLTFQDKTNNESIAVCRQCGPKIDNFLKKRILKENLNGTSTGND